MNIKYPTDEVKGIIKRKIKTPRVVKEINESRDLVKLVVGAGNNPIEGWYNFDVRSRSPQVYFLDVTKDFPFSNGSTDLILCEHLIEHLSFNDGLRMLKESYRILKAGGKFRVSTPDLAKVVSLYGKINGPEGEYTRWITDFVPELRNNHRNTYQFTINNAFHNWGHQFLYDESLLREALEKSSFTNIKRFKYGESDCEHFRGAEIHGRVVKNEKMVNFESLILEGEK